MDSDVITHRAIDIGDQSVSRRGPTIVNKGALACILEMGLHGKLGQRGVSKFEPASPPPILQVQSVDKF
jgi:hypothetical protein